MVGHAIGVETRPRHPKGALIHRGLVTSKPWQIIVEPVFDVETAAAEDDAALYPSLASEEKMPPVFIFAGSKYLNLNKISEVSRKRDGKFNIFIDDEVADDNNADFENKITTVIPVSGEWECLQKVSEEDGQFSVYREPVLAWGFSVFGHLVPVVPSNMGGDDDWVALRKCGEEKIYTSVGDYDDLNAWIAAEGTPG